jgi:hemoglobin
MGWMGGERTYQAAYGSLNIPMAHAHLDVTPALVDNWLNCMRQALAELGHDAKFSDYLIQQLAIPAERIRLVSQQHQNNHQS